jgi:hypothetical protein
MEEQQSPPKRQRSIAIMIGVIILSTIMLYIFRYEFLYFFASRTPKDLGDVALITKANIKDNIYVRLTGFPYYHKVASFSKRLRKGVFKIFPLMSEVRFLIEKNFPENEKGSSELPGEFEGRLTRFKTLGSSYETVRKFINAKFKMNITEDTYIVLDGVKPDDHWWYLIIYGLCSSFIVINITLLFKRFLRWKKEKNKARAKESA